MSSFFAYNVSMQAFFTCVDVTGYDDSHDFYEPTIYEIGSVVPQGHVRDDQVLHPDSIRHLNETPVSVIRSLQRTKGKIFVTLEEVQAAGMSNILSLLHTADPNDRTTASKVQGLWFRESAGFDDLRVVFRSGAQFPPYGEYFTSIDALCHRLENQYRKLDVGDRSEEFRPHQGFTSSGKAHPDFPGYLLEVPHFPELPL